MSLPLFIIPPLDRAATESAARRWDTLTKPQGSLGRLEALAVRIAGMTAQPVPETGRKVIFTVAADHGVAAEGVSAYPQSVTAQMVLNFLRGGAGINVLARHAGAEVIVVDAGVAGEPISAPELVSARVRPGTANMAREPAMSREEAEQSVKTGMQLFREAHRKKRIGLIGLGDMGIGNTTCSSAITALLTGKPVETVTGRGTGLDDDHLSRKTALIEQALRLHQPDPEDGIDVLSKVGGLEIGMLAGIALAAAESRVPVVLDGFITTAAALVAWKLKPAIKDYFIASHRSVEPGHRAALQALELEPLLDLSLRLGEGTGAALAFGIIDASLKLLREMATFGEARVDEKERKEPVK
jgi:nicotinate-nucleotide--dimethylbenzimidazole phosphoribosyltransferase